MSILALTTGNSKNKPNQTKTKTKAKQQNPYLGDENTMKEIQIWT